MHVIMVMWRYQKVFSTLDDYCGHSTKALIEICCCFSKPIDKKTLLHLNIWVERLNGFVFISLKKIFHWCLWKYGMNSHTLCKRQLTKLLKYLLHCFSDVDRRKYLTDQASDYYLDKWGLYCHMSTKMLHWLR